MPKLYLAIAILSEICATSALKSVDGFHRLLPSVAVFAGYGCAFYFMSLALRTIPLGIAYAIWSGVGIVVLSIVGTLLYHQKLDAPALAGIGLILGGVLVLNLSKSTVPH